MALTAFFGGVQFNHFQNVPYLFTLLSKNLTDFSAQQFCHVDFSFKIFDKSVNKRKFLKMINL